MNTHSTQKGIVNLLVVFWVGLFGLGTALSVTTGTLSEFTKNNNTVAGGEAFYTAESAANEGIYQYFLDDSFASSTYDTLNNTDTSGVSITDFGTHIEVTGSADNKAHREVVQKIITFPEGYAFDYAIYSEGDLSLSGSASTTGNIFANGDISFTGSNAEVNGDAYSASTVEEDNVNGESQEGLDPIPAPQIEIDLYEAAANENGTAFATSSDAKTYLNNQYREGVIFVDDTDHELKISSTGTELHGSLATTGDLDLSGGTYIATEDYAAIVVEGDLRIAGGTSIEGIVYVRGNTSFGAGGGSITGSLISAGGITTETDISGNVEIEYDYDIVSQWQNLTGLSTTSAQSEPSLSWSEQ